MLLLCKFTYPYILVFSFVHLPVHCVQPCFFLCTLTDHPFCFLCTLTRSPLLFPVYTNPITLGVSSVHLPVHPCCFLCTYAYPYILVVSCVHLPLYNCCFLCTLTRSSFLFPVYTYPITLSGSCVHWPLHPCCFLQITVKLFVRKGLVKTLSLREKINYLGFSPKFYRDIIAFQGFQIRKFFAISLFVCKI